jgi:acetyltransferase
LNRKLSRDNSRSPLATIKEFYMVISFATDLIQTSSDWQRRPLDTIFAPKTVAAIGATDKPGSVGRTLLWNLISNPFGGTVYPVNPKRSNVLGIKAYPDLAAIPEPIDLAVIATPASTVPEIVSQCVEVGVKGVIVISAGFREIGETGVQLEQKILSATRHSGMRIIGPNCLGVMNPHLGLNATFAGAMARPGNVGFISQSGALCTSILDWSFRENVGFSSFISIGSMLDVSWGDLIYYLGDDPATNSIVIYMESIGDARSFLSAAREVALSKPIIVIKAGRTEAAAQAAISHTGGMTGSDDILDAAFRRCGILRVDSIKDLFNMAEILCKQPRPKGKRLTILTNAGGPGVLATDALIQGKGELAQLSTETIASLNEILPSHWSHGNPIDILGDATPERYAQALKIAAADPNSDGMLVILTPQAMTKPKETAEQLQQAAKALQGKPLLASWMGGEEVAIGEELLNQSKIYTLPYPDSAAHLFNLMWKYSYNLKGLYETPTRSEDGETKEARSLGTEIIQTVQRSGRTLLTEAESKQLLAAYDIPTVPTQIATDPDRAVAIAEEIGYPVVLKLHSEQITHKTDIGGVHLNLVNAEAVRHAYHAIKESVENISSSTLSSEGYFQGVTVQPMIKLEGYELIIGSSIDPQFGPALLFGTGGQLVEVFQDRALGLPPLNTTLARRMMEQTRIWKALQGVRGRKPIDLNALAKLLVRFSYLVVEQPWIKEIEINPLLASPNNLLALDARVILHDANTPVSQLPTVAIRPYPIQYVRPWTMPDGTKVTIRPIRPEDEPLMVKFNHSVSEESIYFRYFHLIKLQTRVAHERLTRLCFIDYDREMALVAESSDRETGEKTILGVSRLSKQHDRNEAEFGMLIGDRVQGRGLGTELLRILLEIGTKEGLKCIKADILPENTAMQHICSKLGFQIRRDRDLVKAVFPLQQL